VILFRPGPEAGPATELVAITQSDHARFAAELLELWRDGGLPRHPRRAELLFAVREHDNGWREADAAPRISPASGRPCDFLEVSSGDRIEIWRRGVARHRQPYPVLLILEHALRLHSEHRADAEWSEFFAALERTRGELSAQSGISPLEVAEGYGWLALGDALSLLACRRQGRELTQGALYARASGNRLLLDPFPLAGATTFAVPCRRIPDRGYSTAAEAGLALAQARWEDTEIRVVPAVPAAG
jgi:hypothetical protein